MKTFNEVIGLDPHKIKCQCGEDLIFFKGKDAYIKNPPKNLDGFRTRHDCEYMTIYRPVEKLTHYFYRKKP